MSFGTCDACGRNAVMLSRCDAYGIETYACAQCTGGEPRRCETNECDWDGSCICCGALSGEVCLDAQSDAERAQAKEGE